MNRTDARAWGLTNVGYGQHPPVVHWQVGLPEQRDERWFFRTGSRRPPWVLSKWYARRMTVEEPLQDGKNRWAGHALGATQPRRANRIDRGLSILTLAYIRLVELGLRARRRYRPRGVVPQKPTARVQHVQNHTGHAGPNGRSGPVGRCHHDRCRGRRRAEAGRLRRIVA